VRRLLRTIIGAVLVLLLWTGSAAAHETYKVKRGDTLSQIAASHGVSWPKLYEANRSVVGGNPDLIFPGQKLTIGEGAKASKPKAPAPDTASSTSSSTVRPATGAVTSPYGYRTHPITGVYKLHTGIDYAYGDGKARAARAGRVSVEHPGWAGNLVVIDHGGGAVTRYAHLASVSVSSGQQAAAGDVVGRIGERGLATGPHLHFEVLIDGRFVNPTSWLD
jgi:murein DD-endopeptidase MepM/ murein hydrolase activator NlpD